MSHTQGKKVENLEKVHKNRNPIQQWFITYPQWTKTEDKDNRLMKELTDTLPPSKYSYCVQESHKTEGFHYHLVIVFIKGITFQKLIKWISVKYPDDWKRVKIEPMRSIQQSLDYCKKESTVFYEMGALEKKKMEIPLTSQETAWAEKHLTLQEKWWWLGSRTHLMELLGRHNAEATNLGITLAEFLDL